MSDPHIQSLLFPLSEDVEIPEGGRILCIGLRETSPALAQLAAELTFVQAFRPHYLALAAAGHPVLPEMPADRFHAALIRLGRHRRQNEAWIAAALCRLHPGGSVIVAGDRTEGAASLRKRIARSVPDIAHAAMNHGEVFWFSLSPASRELANLLRPAPLPPIDGRFHTAAGMFSTGHIDPGSRLLTDHLSPELAGRLADFGAGWGYLAAMAAENCPSARRIDLYEADFDSLQAARRNVPQRDGLEIGFFWHDLVTESVADGYDVILSNPPFHVGRKSEPDLGLAILARAATALNPGGRLLLVANLQLPYEQFLRERFAHVRQLAAAKGYKVLEARKRTRTA